MAQEHLTYDDLLRIVELIKSTEHFSEFRLKVGEIEVELRRRRAAGTVTPRVSPVEASSVESMAGAGYAERERASAGAGATWPEGSVIVRSPMVGTFYRASAPGATPFVEVGQTVEPGTTVCIIEVMKLMNSIVAGITGTVVQVLVDDAATVEAAQPLIVLRSIPAGDDKMRVE